MRAHLIAALALALCACGRETKPAPPPIVIEKAVKHYVPIDRELRKRCDWPKDAKPSEAIEVARKRRECLVQYETQLDGIDRVEGGPTP